MAIGRDAAGEQVVHQPRLDLLILRNQRLRLLNRLVHRRKNFGDPALLREREYVNLNSCEPCLLNTKDSAAGRLANQFGLKRLRLKKLKEIGWFGKSLYSPLEE